VLGALNYSQNASAQVLVTSAAPQNVVSTIITTNGNPVQIICSGDANYAASAFNGRIQLYRGGVGGTALGKTIWLEASAGNENQGYCIQAIDTPAAGTYSYYLVLVSAAPAPSSGNPWQFGEADGPVISAVELQNVRGDTGPASFAYTGYKFVNANTQLTAADAGSMIQLNAGANNIYLPAASTSPVGTIYSFTNNSVTTTTVNISTGTSNFIYNGGT